MEDREDANFVFLNPIDENIRIAREDQLAFSFKARATEAWRSLKKLR